MALFRCQSGNGGGSVTITRHVDNSASITNGKITLTSVTGTVIFATVVFHLTNVRVDVCDYVNDTILESYNEGNFNSESKSRITQSGTTAEITTTTSGSYSCKVVYYTID